MIVEDFEKFIWNSDYRVEFVYAKMDSAISYFNKMAIIWKNYLKKN